MLVAANANAELLCILSQAREKVYLANDRQAANGTRLVDASQLREFAQSLEQWAVKFPAFTPNTDPAFLATCPK